MTDHTYVIQLTGIERAQLEKLAAFEEREPADLLRAFVIDGLDRRRERRREVEIMTGGRSRGKR